MNRASADDSKYDEYGNNRKCFTHKNFSILVSAQGAARLVRQDSGELFVRQCGTALLDELTCHCGDGHGIAFAACRLAGADDLVFGTIRVYSRFLDSGYEFPLRTLALFRGWDGRDFTRTAIFRGVGSRRAGRRCA